MGAGGLSPLAPLTLTTGNRPTNTTPARPPATDMTDNSTLHR